MKYLRNPSSRGLTNDKKMKKKQKQKKKDYFPSEPAPLVWNVNNPWQNISKRRAVSDIAEVGLSLAARSIHPEITIERQKGRLRPLSVFWEAQR